MSLCRWVINRYVFNVYCWLGTEPSIGNTKMTKTDPVPTLQGLTAHLCGRESQEIGAIGRCRPTLRCSGSWVEGVAWGCSQYSGNSSQEVTFESRPEWWKGASCEDGETEFISREALCEGVDSRHGRKGRRWGVEVMEAGGMQKPVGHSREFGFYLHCRWRLLKLWDNEIWAWGSSHWLLSGELKSPW